jgi:hypothetical protein
VSSSDIEARLDRFVLSPAGEVGAIVTEWLTEFATLQGSVPTVS